MTSTRQALKRVLSGVMPPEMLLLRGQTTSSSRTSPLSAVTRISLSFDDGPHPVYTPRVLDALDELEWKATFFLIGRDAEAHPDLVKDIAGRGHQIGNHTYSHAEPDTISAAELMNEVRRTDELLYGLTGQECTLVRPPKGRLDLRKIASLWNANHSVVLWNVDPRDYSMTRSSQAHDWAATYDPAPGDIVLLHDRLPYADTIVRELAKSHRERLVSVPVSSWLQTPSPRPDWRHKLVGLFAS